MPILTTKKAYWKSAIAEMIGYLRGYTSAADFRALGCNTWNANANENEAWLKNPHRKGVDDMGRAYRFRESGYYSNSITIKKEPPKDIQTPKVQELIDPDYTSNKHNLIGNLHNSNSYGRFVVINEHTKNGESLELFFDIQFLKTGYIKKSVRKAEILKGEIRDIYFPIVCGIGCYGDLNAFDTYLIDILKPVWRNMIGRCYEESNNRTVWYKDEGVFVDSRWLVFENFVNDFTKLPRWELKKVFPEEYSLDKDWSNSNYYSIDTCRWATKKEQSVNSRSTNTFIAKNLETGETVLAKGAAEFGKKYNLPKNFAANIIGKYVYGDTFVYHNWEITKKCPSDILYTEVDQFKEIYAKIKLGIDDRRLIMTAYQPHSRQQECLPACMHTHTFSILDGTLYLTSYQRSIDVPLGLGFNQIQCFFLLSIMAQITNLKAGTVYHKLVNCHIYEDQLDLLKEQIERKPFKQPTFKMNANIKTLWDLERWVTLDDFSLEGYQHHSAIKFPFSV
jgi:thymidylate synthase